MGKKPKSVTLISLAMYSLMLKKNYDDISVKDICEKAGLSRMSFYRYFNSKEDIFLSFCDERFAEFYDDIMRYDDMSLEIFMTLILGYFKKYSRQIKILEKANKLQLLLVQFESYASYLLNRLNGNNMKRLRDNPLAVPFLAGGLFSVLIKWSARNFKESEELVTKRVMELLQQD